MDTLPNLGPLADIAPYKIDHQIETVLPGSANTIQNLKDRIQRVLSEQDNFFDFYKWFLFSIEKREDMEKIIHDMFCEVGFQPMQYPLSDGATKQYAEKPTKSDIYGGITRKDELKSYLKSHQGSQELLRYCIATYAEKDGNIFCLELSIDSNDALLRQEMNRKFSERTGMIPTQNTTLHSAIDKDSREKLGGYYKSREIKCRPESNI